MSLFITIFYFIKKNNDIDIWYHLVVEYKKVSQGEQNTY